MKTTFDVDVSKTGASFSYDWNSLPETTREYIIAYGLRQKLNDAHAAIKRVDHASDAQYLDAVTKRVNDVDKALRDGVLTVRVANPAAAADRATAKIAREYNASPEDLRAALELLRAGKPTPSPAAPETAPKTEHVAPTRGKKRAA